MPDNTDTAPDTTVTPAAAPSAAEPTTVEALPQWAQDLIKSTRTEAAKYRTEKTSAVEQAKLEAAEAAKALADQKSALENELSATKLADLKRKAALNAGVSADKADEFASLLQGQTEEELKAHAEKVRDLVGVRPLAVDPTQGAAGTTPVPQLTQADLSRMAPAAIVQAKAEGRLNNLLGRN